MDFPSSSAESIELLAQVPVGSPIVVAPFGTISLGPFDVRKFSSYYLKVYSIAVGSGTAYNTTQVDLVWTSIPGSDAVYQEDVEWWSDSQGGAFPFFGNIMMMQDVQHGPFLFGSIFNNSAADSMNINYSFFGSSRQLPGPYFRQQGGDDGILINNIGVAIGAGATIQVPFKFGYGRTWQRVQSFGPAMNFTMFAGLTQLDLIGPVTGATVRSEYVYPKRSMRIDVFNSGAASTYSLAAVTQYDKV